MKVEILCVALSACFSLFVKANDRWTISPEGNSIKMMVTDNRLPHSDHIEMSGKKMSTVLYWSIDSNAVLSLDRSLVFPMLRTIPNNTHASLMLTNDIDLAKMIRINEKKIVPTVSEVELDGVMKITSNYLCPDGASVSLIQTITPSVEHPALVEIYKAYNSGDKSVRLLVPSVEQYYATAPERGVDGSYIIKSDVLGAGSYTLNPGDTIDFSLIIQAYKALSQDPVELNPEQEFYARQRLVSLLDNNLILETPDRAIDTEFRYAKIRASESIYKTKGGYMHGPGGESYYAALWCNDQAEYVNPLFPFLGYDVGNESALNCFRHYARFINDDYLPIPSSIIAEGDDIWNGAGDRGDAAMLAYGASRYALARGVKSEAQELWPLIEWCLEYCRRKLNEDGVVLSDHDELEGRFPAGDANLCTASLYYDALISASYLCKELNKPSAQKANYLKQAKELRKAIENYFGCNVQGFDTYRYYDGNDVLRSWICIPLVMGINDRADQTVKALFSPEMYTSDGVLTCQGFPVFWDRATLYTLRGALYAGYPDEVIPRLSDFSRRRLLGDHVPYPVEAWPEGSQRHLSAESGLYCRVITEGLFGIRPTGLRSFEIKPQLPKDWNFARLKNIRAFDSDFDISVERRNGDKLQLVVSDKTTGKSKRFSIKAGESVSLRL